MRAPILFFPLFYIIVLALSLPAQAVAGAWLQPAGKGYTASVISVFSTDRFFDVAGIKTPQSRFTKIETNFYAEYGLYEWLTIGSNLFINRAQQDGIHNLGIADPEFFIRLPLLDYQGWRTSLQPLIKLPSLYENSNTPRAGSRAMDLELSLLLGRNITLYGFDGYMDIRLGYRNRSRGLDAQYRADIAYGLHVNNRLTLIPAIRAIIAKNIDPNEPFREDGEQNFDLFKLELGLQYQLDNGKKLIATGFTHTKGANAGAGNGISLGVAWAF
jgi:hypothetical protein